MRALDIMRAVEALREISGGKQISVVAKRIACVPALHAAVLDEQIASLTLEGGLVSWRAMVEAKLHRDRQDDVVPGALAVYDLPWLATALAPRPLALISMTGAVGDVLAAEEVEADYAAALSVYNAGGISQKMIVAERTQDVNITDMIGPILSPLN
jgi:hypothetical protein